MPDIDGRVILLILFVVISAVKWLIEKIQANDQAAEQEEPADNLETLYDEYRDEIRQRQTKLEKRQATQTPPPIPVQATVQAPARPPARPPVAAPAPPVYTQRQSTSMGAPVSTPVNTAQPAPSFNRGRPQSPRSKKQQPHVSNNCRLARASRVHKVTCAPYCPTHSPLVRRSSLRKSSASPSHFRAANFFLA